MNKHFKYDPEDIESLMLAKPFDDLLPEERTFVLKHLASEREYELMRHSLLASMKVLQSDQSEPPRELKEKMMSQFRSHHEKSPFGKIWLNLFTPVWISFWQRPYLSLAMASVLLFLGVLFWMENPETPELAIQNEAPRSENSGQDQFGAQSDSEIEQSPVQAEERTLERSTRPESKATEKTIEKPPAPQGQEFASEESNEPRPKSGSAQVLEDNLVVEDGSVEQEDIQPLTEADFAAEPPHPAAATNVAADVITDTNAGKASAPGVKLINDELLAILYTAR